MIAAMLTRDDLRDWLDPEAPTVPARLFRAGQFLAVATGLGAAVGSSVDELWASDAALWLVAAVAVVLVAFAVEYGVRLMLAGEERWVETESVAHACRRYLQSALGMIDLLAFAPMAI